MPAASITRAAIFFAGATAVSACSSTTTPPVGVLYGPVQMDAGETKDGGETKDSGEAKDSGEKRDGGRTGFPDGAIGILYGPVPH
jgi:hypothetical protein